VTKQGVDKHWGDMERQAKEAVEEEWAWPKRGAMVPID